MLDTCGFVGYNESNDVSEDDQDEYDVKKEPISLEALQEQINDMQGSIGYITQMLQKITNEI